MKDKLRDRYPPKDTKHDEVNRMRFKPNVKAWIAFEKSGDNYSCHLILENGHPMYSDTCSDPAKAIDILWNKRPERKAEWKKAGVELKIVDTIPIEELPQHVFDNNKKEAYMYFMNKYFPHHVQVEGEVIAEV